MLKLPEQAHWFIFAYRLCALKMEKLPAPHEADSNVATLEKRLNYPKLGFQNLLEVNRLRRENRL